jgi:hypothetical protein
MSSVTMTARDHTDHDGVVRAFVIGSVVGCLVVFALFAGVSMLCGLTAPAAVGIGLFTAVFGGPGFGGMVGAVLHQTHHEGT